MIRRWLRRLALMLLFLTLCGGALVVLGLIEAIEDPVRREITLTVPDLPADQSSYRVALISDIHYGNRAMRRERLDRIVATINAAHPDLVLIAGDFVNGHGGKTVPPPAEMAAPLAKLRARDGMIAVLGNHDYWMDTPGIRKALTAAGITVLENQPARRGPLLIVGIGDRFSHHDDIAAAEASAAGQGGVPVVLTHSPDLVRDLPARLPLTLAGHTHCGQIVLPVIGGIADHKHVYNPHYRCGVVRDGARTTIVTGGVGSGGIPLRIGAEPDWWLITLRR